MENDAKVFTSNITRAGNNQNNNLYDLLNIVPAKPQRATAIKTYNCDFKPKTDKYYIPKRKSKLKVKTVGDIRKSFEQDTFSYLSNDLESQNKLLFKRIKRGSSKDDDTKSLAKSILKLDKPILRSTWQMLININPEQHAHPRQFVKWNGKHIQVNGSHGSSKKFICDYDLAFKEFTSKNVKNNMYKPTTFNKKKGLIRNSLAVKFKPGPLGKKMFLDHSHQKYNIGNAELIRLPKPGLDIQPTYGTALESTMTNFLNNLRKEDGTITQKWAELAVSVLGKVEKSNFVQLNKDCVTFDLNYKYSRHRILMRRDMENVFTKPKLIESERINKERKSFEYTVLPEVEDMMNKILDSVEINVIQNKIYKQDEKESNFLKDSNSSHIDTNVKTKRRFCELDRLDVTVITVPETNKQDVDRCVKAHCRLGCICMSLDRTQSLRQHCGRVRCMFECGCDSFNYNGGLSYLVDNDFECIPNLDKKMNVKLAKEEQKFHQTVIVSGERKILLKAERRNSKIPEKYAEYYNNIRYKQENQKKLVISIVAPKLNFANVEPWCMVHKLYKCFCKGRFTDTCESPKEISETTPLDHTVSVARDKYSINSMNISESSRLDPDDNTKIKDIPVVPSKNAEAIENTSVVGVAKYQTRFASRNFDSDSKKQDCDEHPQEISSSPECSEYLYENDTARCSRTIAYKGRKFSDGYYRHTNNKILEMEKNDKRLQGRLSLLNKNLHDDKCVKKRAISTTIDSSVFKILYNDDNMYPQPVQSDEIIPSQSKRKRLSSETRLVAWLETNYKMYKIRSDQGLIKNSLEPPKLGKIGLHSWEFILNRYREQKNLFLVSQQEPFRMFMAVHTRHPFFDNCLNINDIRFADLHKYPQTVKNLLINATDLKEYFCILRGLSFCWEVIGSVAKVNEDQDSQEINIESSERETFFICDDSDNTLVEKFSFEASKQNKVETHSSTHKTAVNSTEISEEAISSKWFVMTIENDFTEIRFPDKGFFVTHKSIMKVICMARLAKKTVRLSSKQCMEKSENPSFGIYAMPNTNENCVLVGPYELKDPLGIETVKTFLDLRKMNTTRGFWIKTNNVDNLQVVENPLSFMSLANPQSNDTMPLESHCSVEHFLDQNQPGNLDKIEKAKQLNSPQKVVKPIKIRKTNGFYHLASDGILKKISSPPNLSKTMPVLSNTCLNIGQDSASLLLRSPSSNMKIAQINYSSEPMVKTTPEIEATDASSSQNENPSKSVMKQDRMFILKPEEINRKLLLEKETSLSTAIAPNEFGSDDDPSNADLTELVLDNTSEPECFSTTNDDVYIISDDDESITEFKTENDLRDVWIESTNVHDLGWIAGRRNSNNLLSFKFPGYDYSQFYTEEKAFLYINLKLSEISSSSMSEEIKWKVIESPELLKGNEIDPEKLFKDNVLSKEELQLKSNALEFDRDNLRTYKKKTQRVKALSPYFQPAFSKDMDSTVQIDLPDTEENSFKAKKGQIQ